MERKSVNNPEFYSRIKDVVETSPYSAEQTVKILVGNMVGMAKADGVDDKEIADAVMKIMKSPAMEAEPKAEMNIASPKPVSLLATQKDASDIRRQITFWQNFLLFFELIFSVEVQRYSYRVLEKLKYKNLYRHEMKKYANKLEEETRQMQMRFKDSDRLLTVKWCKEVGILPRWAEEFYEDGASAAGRFNVAFRKKYGKGLKLVELDCKELAEKLDVKHPDLLADLLVLIAITESGIELFDLCLKRIRQAGRGRVRLSITKSPHYESLRNHARNIQDKFMPRMAVLPQAEAQRARTNLSKWQEEITRGGVNGFFDKELDALKVEYVDYTLAKMRIGMEEGNIGRDALRSLLVRLGHKSAVRSLLKQLYKVQMPGDSDADILDVAEAIAGYDKRAVTLRAYRDMCIYGKFYEPSEKEMKLDELRVIRGVARKFGGQLPDDVLRVMVMHHKTKKGLMDQLVKAGAELRPTLNRVRKMKVSELKQL